MHWTLTPKTNMRFLVLWAVLVAVSCLVLTGRARLLFVLAGATLGAVAGWLQLRAMRQSAGALLMAENAIAIRRVLASTASGRSYLVLFWVSQLAVFGMAIGTQGLRAPIAVLAGYVAFAFAREALTLAGSRELDRLEREATGATQGVS